MRERGPFILSCQTRNDKALDAENMLHALLKEFIEKGPTDEELDAAKRNLLGGYALNFSSNADIAGQVSMLAFYNLDLDYFNQYKAAVEKLSAREIRKAFQRRISPDKVVVVKVGGKPDAQQAGKPIEPATMSHHGDIKS
jgi:zinc protease